MPRVALFYSNLTTYGGVGRVFANLIHGFAQRGIDVDMVLIRAEGPFPKSLPPQASVFDLQGADIPLRWIWSSHHLQQHVIPLQFELSIKVIIFIFKPLLRLTRYLHNRNLRNFLYYRLLAFKFSSYLRQRKPDAVLSANDSNLIALMSKQFALTSSHFVASQRGMLSIHWHSHPNLLLAKHLYPTADKIVAVSHGVAEDLCRTLNLSMQQIQVIYNPTITPELFLKAKEPANHPWFEERNIPIVLSAGRLAREKDFPTLLHAFALVRQQRPARLVILGDGKERPNLEHLVKQLNIHEDVDMPGFVENPFAFMSRANLFVLSSAWEGLPNALIEALACGCPVVSTDCPSGPREILDNGRYGRLVPVGDHEALARAMLEALDDPDNPCDKETRIKRAMDFLVDKAVDEYLRVLLP